MKVGDRIDVFKVLCDGYWFAAPNITGPRILNPTILSETFAVKVGTLIIKTIK